MDFGLAKAVLGDSPGSDPSQSPTVTAAATATGVILGTAAYMSPEQARGKPVDKRSDIWSFGCVLYEMLSGQVAFPGETFSDTIAGILDREPDWYAVPADTPPFTRRLLRRCLQRDRRQRLHDIADARLELDDREKGVDAIGPAERQAMPLWWQALPWVSLAVVVVTALAFLSDERGLEPEVTRFALNLPGGSQVAFVGGSGVAVSPDGRTVVFSAVDGGWQLYRRDMDTLESVPIRGTDGARGPFFSPDGAAVGFFTGFEPRELKRVPLSGGIPVTLGEVRGSSAGTWLEDDSIIFGGIGPVGQRLSRVPASGGEPSPVASFTENGIEASHSYPSAQL